MIQLERKAHVTEEIERTMETRGRGLGTEYLVTMNGIVRKEVSNKESCS